ncbi:MAG TPA: hypothetical protein VFJ02_01020 [Vicinamibacterales bacterium]|nr:hypothetical protein [Vicinamibacterales bacterium]
MTRHHGGYLTSRVVAAIALACAACIVVTAQSQPPSQPPAAKSTPSPTEVFLAYRTALAKATSYSELLPFMDAKGRGMIEAMPDQQRSGMFELLKKFAGTFTEVSVTKETITDDTAVLALAGKDPKGQPATGSVSMSREADGWKVGTEKWSSRPR